MIPLTGGVILPDTDSAGDVNFRDPQLTSDLRLVKTIDNGLAFPFTNTFFTIQVFNDGPNDVSTGRN